jgi:hypothetical protein
MHFYPGVARYEQPGQEPFTVLINENVIREMGPSFAGRPIYVQHTDDVPENLETLREEADGWVVESFYNKADGKHWAKFIVVSDEAMAAIKDGWKLSNAYIPECVDEPGMWNAVPYDRKVVSGEFEHLAIVQNPRYEESVIMTPEQFKSYNEKKTVELTRLANSKDKQGEPKMKLNIFKRAKIENGVDLDGMIVELPKSKKEMSLTKVVEEYDKIMNMNGYANGDHMVKVGDKDEMSVNDLVKKHIEMANEMEAMKTKNAATEDGGEPGEDDDSMDNEALDINQDGDVGDRGGDESLGNAEDDEEKEEKKDDKKDKVKNELATKKLAKEKALRLKNAHLREQNEEAVSIALPQEMVARGKSLYGSND